jgi:predicted deacylase
LVEPLIVTFLTDPAEAFMIVEVLGDGRPEHAVVACVHGDETCGWHAFNRLKARGVAFQKPLKFVLANERAWKLGLRYCDEDLNRVAPGDPESTAYERRLAARLRQELDGLKVLDIHSTESRSCPFAIVVGRSAATLNLARATGLRRVIDMSHVPGGLTQDLDGVAIECGYHDDEDAASIAFRTLRRFLAAEGVIDGPVERPELEVYEVFEVAAGRDYEVVVDNFSRVEPGEVYAHKDTTVRRAEQPFYPVLMSNDGYEDLIGFKARKVAPTQSAASPSMMWPHGNGR